MIAAAIFDMDGLMFDTERLCMKAWDAVGEEIGIGPVGYMNLKTLGVTAEKAEEIWKAEFGPDFDFFDFRARSRAFTDRYFAENPFPVKPGLYTLLDFLKEKGIPMAVASSSREAVIRHHLQAAGVEGYFSVIASGDMVTHSKPHPEIFLLACKKLGKAPETCCVLEDSPYGLQAARAAGCMPLMVPDLWQPDKETLEFLAAKADTLDGLIPWIIRNV